MTVQERLVHLSSRELHLTIDALMYELHRRAAAGDEAAIEGVERIVGIRLVKGAPVPPIPTREILDRLQQTQTAISNLDPSDEKGSEIAARLFSVTKESLLYEFGKRGNDPEAVAAIQKIQSLL